ncbi:hypothetical protein [Phenylobacterium aquaticum]|uniref:hypothetical protein n=1 Tax=Phenylobacterium aquaticum TaxID=1763816 RepID=UPI0026E9E9D5|nr:hypothetical protein [Phenylobacterium aquaticum]
MTRFVLIGAILAVIACGAADADPSGRDPIWTAAPSPGDMDRATPVAGRLTGGAASLRCVVAADGALGACAIEAEQPQGLGFGVAALGLVARLKMKPTWADGVSAVGANLVVPFTFEAAPPLREVRGRRGEAFNGAGPYYPDRAFRNRVGGEAALDCQLSVDGRLHDCQAAWEYPLGEHFSDAARVMAQAGAITAAPRLIDNRPVADERVRVIVPFGSLRR